MRKETLIRYRELLKDKKALFDSYRLTTMQLKEALDKKSLMNVRSCIANRQQMINRINRIDQMLRTGTDKIHFNMESTDNHMGEKTGILFKDMEQILNEISVLENDCMDLVAAERDLLKNELLGYQQSKRGTKGYQSGKAAPAKFIDTMIR